ncbi:mitogen-activated protein kinase kinase kinase kinase 4-like protein [Pseudohyphozyma bogoriensis]|nr:mitogen-activated protein kinase kinase kinase kinase 4-like protein [Pseudohyphozyma bogoriensis]
MSAVSSVRDSGSSLGSFASRRPLSPNLSISVPSPEPFLASLSSRRPTSSIWQSTVGTDGDDNDDDSDADDRRDGPEAWEDEVEVAHAEGARQGSRGMLSGASSSDGGGAGQRYYSAGEPDDDDDAVHPGDEPPSTPITLPPAALHDRRPSPPSPSFVESGSPRNSYPSSDEGLNMNIGLGVSPSVLARQERRLRMQSMESMRERTGTPNFSGVAGIMEDEEPPWKEDVIVQDEVLEQPVVDVGVGGSTSGSASLPFPSFQPSPSTLSIPTSVGAAHGDPVRDVSPVSPTDGRPETPASSTLRSPRRSTGSTTAASSNSSTLSLPSVPPVDLTLPNRSTGTFVSVANGPMARLAADGNAMGLTRSNSNRGPRAFLSNLLTGLSLVPLTLALSLSKHSQPLCGAILDDKYILIGTTGGLDFLPIPLPGSLPMKQHGKKRRETRKPIPLIKRTRFKELAVLSERSNILLAIAGRNDHIRVYALDGIRAMIEKKMVELDIRDGYPIIPDPRGSYADSPPLPRPREDLDRGNEADSELLAPVKPARRASTTSTGESGWSTDPSVSPVVPRTARMEPRDSITRSSALELAEFFRTTAPSPVSEESGPPLRTSRNASISNMSTRSALSGSSMARSPIIDGMAEREANQELAEFVRNGPPKKLEARQASSPPLRQYERSPTADLADMLRETGPSASSSRNSGTPPRVQDRGISSESPEVVRRSSVESLVRAVRGHRALSGSGTTFTNPFASNTKISTDSQLLDAPGKGKTSSSPLEYVKLARTKGARLLRAVETKKRTYLAVLCGDEGERIELFTGSRSISLSLNRTFVLPENPRTIEFQIQGDDLIDIYLVYPESIFALEPATVRVREVGVGRGERRARRDRERRMRDIASTATEEPGQVTTGTSQSTTLHPADPALNEPTSPSPSPAADDSANDLELPGSSPTPTRTPSPTPPRPVSRNGMSDIPPPPPPRSPSSNRRPPTPARAHSFDDSESATPTRSKLPYTTFQQLPFVPPVPSAVLASAWIIPPLYTDVVAGNETASPLQPSITVTGEAWAAPPHFQDAPLLSPISLLGGAAQRANGPPGLFFVSKGRNLSGIVTGDGRSVIKKPLVWNADKTSDAEHGLDTYRRIEILIVGGNRTVVVGVGSSEVKAIAVQGEGGQAPFSSAISVTPTPSLRPNDAREIEFLGNHSVTNQLFFTERTMSFAAARARQLEANRLMLHELGLPKIVAAIDSFTVAPKLQPKTPKAKKVRREAFVTPTKEGEENAGADAGCRRSRRVRKAIQRYKDEDFDDSESEGEMSDLYDSDDDASDDEPGEGGKRKKQRQGGAAPKSLKKGGRPNPKKFGHQPGTPVGKTWEFRMACSQDGIHAPVVAGIAGNEEVGCWSIALSGGYEDDLDLGHAFTYTGSGGRDLKGTKAAPKNLRTAPQSSDQTFTKLNAAIAKSVETKKPIRVIRGFKGHSAWAPETGYRYDGLYICTKAWMDVGESGFKVCRYAFKRMDGQPPIPVRPGREAEAEEILSQFK